jgi:hypothetical protein
VLKVDQLKQLAVDIQDEPVLEVGCGGHLHQV